MRVHAVGIFRSLKPEGFLPNMERLLLFLLLVTIGCGGEEDAHPEETLASTARWAENIEEPVPTWLSETGVFSDLSTWSF